MTEQMETAVETTIDTVATDTALQDAEQAQELTEAAEQTYEAAKVENSAEQGAAENESANANAEEDRIFTPVYNGAVMPVKASDTARVTTLLQKGMKFEHMAGDLEKLHQLKAMCGAKTIGDAIGVLLDEKEQARQAEYESLYGQEAAKKLMELEKAESGSFRETDEAADQASREALAARLSGEFAELREEYPEVGTVSALPREVIDTAVQKGITLLDAYNRYTLREQKRIASAMQQQANNRQTATGSLADHGAEVSDPVWDAFMRGAARAAKR